MAPAKWTAIVLTCQNKHYAQAFQNELEMWQKKGMIDEGVIILTVEDPRSKVGSGGATINALLVVTEYISAKAGYTAVNADLISDAHVLILHMGRDFAFDACGRAFCTLPFSRRSGSADGLVTNLQLLLHTMTTKVAANSPPGVWVCSTDMFLHIPLSANIPSLEGVSVCVLTVPGTVEYAANHGVYKVNEDSFLEDIVYQGTEEAIRKCCMPDGNVLIVSGIVYFSPKVSEKLLMSTLNVCTYLGLDSGAQPIQLSLFFDLLLSMCSAISENEFVSGSRSGSYGKAMTANSSEEDQHTMRVVRRAIWQQLRETSIKVLFVPSGRHTYMSMSASDHLSHLTSCTSDNAENWSMSKLTHSYVHPDAKCSESTVINSVVNSKVEIGFGTVVSHCELADDVKLGANSIYSGLVKQDLMGLEINLRDDMVMQVFHLDDEIGRNKSKAYTILSRHDDLQLSVEHSGSTFLNVPWEAFFTRTNITAADLWDASVDASQQTLFNARLFPVSSAPDNMAAKIVLWLQGSDSDISLQTWRSSLRLSMAAILKRVDIATEMDRRRALFFNVAERQVGQTLLDCTNKGLVRLYVSAVIEGYARSMLTHLDKVALQCQSLGIVARTLANVARLLACMAQGQGGLASGPAGNKQWMPAFRLLEDGHVTQGIHALSAEREHWLDRPSLLMRAARHYMGAAQILIRNAVMSVAQFIRRSPCELPALGCWVTAECPARIDLAGGWSDLPPITYEHGGVVLNAAILIDGKKPIGAKVRRIERCELHLYIEDDGGEYSKLVISELSQLSDYNQPQAPGALLKAAFRTAELVDFSSAHSSLSQQLCEAYGSGFELYTWSRLPHGSGLGTSSILAGAAIAAIWRASGHMFDINSLVHAVLQCEQLLTTGGGWQDQVGGLVPGGVKLSRTAARLPVHVDISRPVISEDMLQKLNDRLLLIYTGKTRLAKNLLQNVMLSWYARDPSIMRLQDDLVSNAFAAKDAFEKGDLDMVGACFDAYWGQKKLAAVGCEPREVAVLRESLRPILLGSSLAGAGGGGFLCLITRQPHARDEVIRVLKATEGVENMVLHSTCIDTTGISLTVEGQGQVNLDFRDAERTL